MGPVAVDDSDASAFHVDLTAQGPAAGGEIVIASHNFDRSDRFEGRNGLGAVHVARMADQVDSSKHLEQPVWQLVQELWAVRVRDDSDTRGHAETSLIGGAVY